EAGMIQMVRGKDLLDSLPDDGVVMPDSKPEVEKKDIWQDFVHHVLSFLDVTEIIPMKIVVDASNGVGGLALKALADKLPIEIIPVNFTPDGNFPNHSPNPLEPGAADMAKQGILEEQADFGVMFDGDADRIFLVDEAGTLVSADTTLLLLAKY